MDTSSQDKLQTLLSWKQDIETALLQLRQKQKETAEAILRSESQLRNINELLQAEGYSVGERVASQEASTASVAEAAYELIKEIGHPVHYREISERLSQSGTMVPGQNPEANLLSYLVRDRRFQWIARGTYALAEWKMRSKPRKRRARKARARG
jgi:hypothetical protein